MSNIINVYGYDVHYIKKSDGTIMYFAADLVKQYNTKNGKKKQFKNCIANKDTIELIQVIAENQEKISGVRGGCNFQRPPYYRQNDKLSVCSKCNRICQNFR